LIQTHARKERLLFLPITRFMAEAPIIKHKWTLKKKAYTLNEFYVTWVFKMRTQRKRENCVFLCLSLLKSGQLCWSVIKQRGYDPTATNWRKLIRAVCSVLSASLGLSVPSEGISQIRLLWSSSEGNDRKRSDCDLPASAVFSNAKVPYFKVACSELYHVATENILFAHFSKSGNKKELKKTNFVILWYLKLRA
jgi:hypothetical protein